MQSTITPITKNPESTATPLHIINFTEIGYHHSNAMHIIKSQIFIHGIAVMIIEEAERQIMLA